MSLVRPSEGMQASFDSPADAQPFDLCRDAIAGLSPRPKKLPSKYLYDDAGSKLFERICALEECYPTRTETSILRENLDEIAELAGPNVRLVEFGSGNAAKTSLLLDRLSKPAEYIPIDISRAALLESATAVAQRFPAMRVIPVWADYTGGLELPPRARAWRTVVFFPGSTIGNFEPGDAEDFLRRAGRLCGPSGRLLLGVDLRKERARLESAYDDPAGVTAAFNLNLLARLNRECGADFDVGSFAHRAVYDDWHGRVEMHLVSARRQGITFTLAPVAEVQALVEFEAGESVVTKHSYKYTLDGFAALARRAGLEPKRSWTDREHLFGVYWLSPLSTATS